MGSNETAGAATTSPRVRLETESNALRASRAGLRPRMSSGVQVQILFSSVGSAPVLRQRRVVTDGALPFSSLHAYLLRQLGEETPRLFLYLKSAFLPCGSDSIGSLFAAHGESGLLHVQYAEQPAWG